MIKSLNKYHNYTPIIFSSNKILCKLENKSFRFINNTSNLEKEIPPSFLYKQELAKIHYEDIDGIYYKNYIFVKKFNDINFNIEHIYFFRSLNLIKDNEGLYYKVYIKYSSSFSDIKQFIINEQKANDYYDLSKGIYLTEYINYSSIKDIVFK